MKYLGALPSPENEYAIALPEGGRDQAHAWLAMFATLLTNPASLRLDDARQRIDLLRFLRAESSKTLALLERETGPEEVELLCTFREALGQLDPIEAELKGQLARLAPGDPQGMVDLTAIRNRMAKFAARTELKSSPTPISHLKLRVPQIASAELAHGITYLCAYTVGWWAFLVFLSLFFPASPFGAALAGMAWGALWLWGLKYLGRARLAGEEVILYGQNLVLVRRFLVWKWKETHRLAPDSRAQPNESFIVIEDEDGTPVRFARDRYRKGRMILTQRINTYLDDLSPLAPTR